MPSLFNESSRSWHLPFGNLQKEHLDWVRPEDLEPIRCWRNAQLAILRQNHPLSPEEQLRYWGQLALSQRAAERPSQLLFAYRKEQLLLGYGGLVHIDWSVYSAEVSSLLPPDLTPELFLQRTHCFLQLTIDLARSHALTKLRTECYDTRIEMIALLEAEGFKRVGYQAERKQLNSELSVGSWYHERDLSFDEKGAERGRRSIVS